MRIACAQFAASVDTIHDNLTRADKIVSLAPDIQRPPTKTPAVNFGPRVPSVWNHVPNIGPDRYGLLDLIVLPVIPFSKEKSLQARALNCNDEATITLQQWAITIARNKGCMVLVTWSYQFDSCNGAETLYHESMLLVNRDGERIGRRQRGCLNKTPAESDIFSLKISDTTKIAVGLSLDIGLTEHQNPSDGPDTYDFATHVVQAGANLVVLSLASTSNQLIETFTTKPEDPDMDTLCHWLSRLLPIFQSSLESSEIIVVLANRRRPAKMDSALFAGTSTIVGIKGPRVRIYGMLARDGKELLSVDTEKDKPSIWYWDGKRLIKDTTPAVPPVADLSVLHMRGRVMYGSEGLHKLDSASLVVPRPSLSLETGISPVEVASWDAKTPGGLTPISSGLRFNPEDLAQAQDGQRLLLGRLSRGRFGIQSETLATPHDTVVSTGLHRQQDQSDEGLSVHRDNESAQPKPHILSGDSATALVVHVSGSSTNGMHDELGKPRYSERHSARSDNWSQASGQSNDPRRSLRNSYDSLAVLGHAPSEVWHPGSGHSSRASSIGPYSRQSRRSSYGDLHSHQSRDNNDQEARFSFNLHDAFNLPNMIGQLDIAELCDLESFLEQNLAIVQMAIKFKKGKAEDTKPVRPGRLGETRLEPLC
ncbi:DNA repair protein rhp41 [Ceratocystis lukuohia]|uniref:DNA repair protein rhp41 n=1 Tax=Ceratocystis lukuohia TaxID=2019550 RepID=A0ABR4MI81_9PEZI